MMPRRKSKFIVTREDLQQLKIILDFYSMIMGFEGVPEPPEVESAFYDLNDLLVRNGIEDSQEGDDE